MFKKQSYLAIAFCLAAGSTWAADFDGSKIMICAPATTMKCSPAGCAHGEAGDVNLDRFLEIDVANKSVRGVSSNRTSPIQHVTHESGQLVMQGSQNARGWSATISEQTGELTITASGENVAFTVFGACMVAP